MVRRQPAQEARRRFALDCGAAIADYYPGVGGRISAESRFELRVNGPPHHPASLAGISRLSLQFMVKKKKKKHEKKPASLNSPQW